jgi:hypothetical protein
MLLSKHAESSTKNERRVVRAFRVNGTLGTTMCPQTEAGALVTAEEALPAMILMRTSSHTYGTDKDPGNLRCLSFSREPTSPTWSHNAMNTGRATSILILRVLDQPWENCKASSERCKDAIKYFCACKHRNSQLFSAVQPRLPRTAPWLLQQAYPAVG